MELDQLKVRRLELIAAIAELPPGEQGAPEWSRREEVLADLRNVNAAIKAGNITAAARAKAAGDAKRARGRAEQRANLQRAGVPVPEPVAVPVPGFVAKRGHQSLGEFLLWQATSLRRTLRKVRDPLPFTVEFTKVVSKFIDEQAEHVRQFKADPEDWRRAWSESDPHPVRRPDGSIPSRPADCTAALGACSCRYCIHDPRVLKLEELHHFLPDTACPACGTDSTTGCVAEYPDASR